MAKQPPRILGRRPSWGLLALGALIVIAAVAGGLWLALSGGGGGKGTEGPTDLVGRVELRVCGRKGCQSFSQARPTITISGAGGYRKTASGDRTGEFRLYLPAGSYLLRATTAAGERRSGQIKVTIRSGFTSSVIIPIGVRG